MNDEIKEITEEMRNSISIMLTCVPRSNLISFLCLVTRLLSALVEEIENES